MAEPGTSAADDLPNGQEDGEAAEPGPAPGEVAVTFHDGAGDEPQRVRRELPPHWAKRLDVGITVAGLVVATLLALALAIVEAFLAPLRLNGSGMRLPISLVLALVTNPLLGWFAFVTTGKRLAALLPAGAWCAVWILAAGRTSEGDLLITDNNWVGLLTLFAGPMAFAIGIYVTALRKRTAMVGARTRGGAPGGTASDGQAGNTPNGQPDGAPNDPNGGDPAGDDSAGGDPAASRP
ncbi:hypothetical protein GCM10010399_19560 [Dactylosporangium fulvum]|uniref:Integral membrane protein n=1 Tax=Dactylosporangium fulvum TaxID=53359 RepID=A0ABY5W143_9ACTN|nr:hypothetical protein [Dactylosporangium fulvum]UWP83737.1 hypothetical protein Dfulv_05570 [Dactylosporangium fulvum]